MLTLGARFLWKNKRGPQESADYIFPDGYDADGIRTYKLTGTCNSSLLNGAKPMAQAVFDDMVLYPSPYMVVTPRGYTNFITLL